MRARVVVILVLCWCAAVGGMILYGPDDWYAKVGYLCFGAALALILVLPFWPKSRVQKWF